MPSFPTESTGTASSSEHERNPSSSRQPLWRADSTTLVADSNWISPSHSGANAAPPESDSDSSNEGAGVAGPSEPQNRFRNRREPLHLSASEGQFPPSHNSPTSTISSSSVGPTSLFRAHASTIHRLTTPPGSQRLTPKRAINIRSDPMMVTCFDPQDKELYDLWAPK